MTEKKEKVVVLGASPKEERYSNQAVLLLAKYGHQVIPVNPAFDNIGGLPTAHKLSDINDTIDTITLYVNEKVSASQKDDILALKPKRVIFNPGAENSSLRDSLKENGIITEEACTLVMLKTGQF
ncbi:MAG: CoA-binding protein [Proteobacteria bacterium]|nr:CoA-binding protein [Pseudomonadota bacterium]